jgi:Leucine-rich repeat (LRR) protein
MERGFTEVPEGIRHLTNLQDLTLTGNKLEHLPIWLPENSKIVWLLIGYNEFSSFPPELERMRNLEVLSLKNNSITALPPTIGNLKSLERLDLRNNNLTDVPNEISQLTALRSLQLGGNRLPASALEKIRRLLPHTSVNFGTQRD